MHFIHFFRFCFVFCSKGFIMFLTLFLKFLAPLPKCYYTAFANVLYIIFIFMLLRLMFAAFIVRYVWSYAKVKVALNFIKSEYMMMLMLKKKKLKMFLLNKMFLQPVLSKNNSDVLLKNYVTITMFFLRCYLAYLHLIWKMDFLIVSQKSYYMN